MKKTQKWLSTIDSIVNYPSIVRKIRKAQTNTFFVFPFYHTGGAERVHADILKVFKKDNVVCLLSNYSVDTNLKQEFHENSTVIDLMRFGWKKSFRNHMAKIVATEINKKKNPVVFGCNSYFFYDLIPHLNKNVRIIDLFHAFTGGEHSYEEYSKPTLDRLYARVVLGNVNLNKFKNFYQENNIDSKEVQKLKIIPNKVDVPKSNITKSFNENLKIYFVGRNSSDKRPELFIKIAKKAKEKNLPFEFYMVGDFHEFKNQADSNIHILGRISDKDQLNELYESAHFVMITSVAEGFPMVLLEGMSRGAIPISTNVGEVSNIVNESQSTGYIIENSDNQEFLLTQFIALLERIIENRQELDIISQNIQEIVRMYFSEEVFEKNYRNLLFS
ncbi:glycosyltransferase family 4 protein [Sphingobacterium hungaricum]